MRYALRDENQRSFRLCLPGFNTSQVDTGTVLSTVTDASGAIIPGAKVTIQNEGTSFTQSTNTSSSGT